MRISNFTKNLGRALKVVLIVQMTSLTLVWLNQKPLARYWEQTYHQPAPWEKLQGNFNWDRGGFLREGMIAAGETLWEYAKGNHLSEISGNVAVSGNAAASGNAAVSGNAAKTNESEVAFADKGEISEEQMDGPRFLHDDRFATLTLSLTVTDLFDWDPPQADGSLLKLNETLVAGQRSVNASPKAVSELKSGDQVFFVGDSLMQGVAPVLQSRLAKAYGIKSINLSKQSTGLAYPDFFDWPETVKTTLAEHPEIRLLVVFLGPNDPWDMPPEDGGAYLSFMSPKWEAQYRKHIQEILDSARRHGADVIWIGSPNMRKRKLSDDVHYLNGLYQSEITHAGEIWLSANAIFKYQDRVYSDYYGDGTSRIRLRGDDGIHFTRQGQKVIADSIFARIKFNAAPK